MMMTEKSLWKKFLIFVFVMFIFFTLTGTASADETEEWAYLHIIHDYDGIVVNPADEYIFNYANCEIETDRVPAGELVNLEDFIQKNYDNYEYIYDSMTLQYEVAEVILSYSDNSYNYAEVHENMVVGDIIDPVLHSEHAEDFYSETPLSEILNPGLTPDPESEKIIRQSSFYPIYLYFTFESLNSMVEPVTFFKNSYDNIPSNDDLLNGNTAFEFEKGLHYVLKINYAKGQPVVHHYISASGEEVYTQGKTLTYDTPLSLYDWKRESHEETAYNLVRIEVVESESTLTVRHYLPGRAVDDMNTLVYMLDASSTTPVYPGSLIDVSTHVGDYPYYNDRLYNTNSSDKPWEEDTKQRVFPDIFIKMSSNENFLNFFYQSILTLVTTIASPDGTYQRTIWTDSDLNPAE